MNLTQSSEQISLLEKDLISAMAKSDVADLDRLISDKLIFVAHTGQIFSKNDDIEAHRSGRIRIETIQASEEIIRIYNDTAIVFVLLKIKGEFFGNPSEGTFRFSRIWAKEENSWKVVAAQSTQMN